jgi:CRP-like cAMP-binding protein
MKSRNYLEAIRKLDLFEHFSEEELRGLFNGRNHEVREFEKNQVIYLQNEVCQTLDIILDGKVSVQRIEEDGHLLRIETFSGGSILGANLIFSTRNVYPMTVVSETNTMIIRMQKDLVLELGKTNMGFMAGLLKVISDRTLVLTDKINTISPRSIRKKIIDFLLEEYRLQGAVVIVLGISKRELAERLGMQRTSLSRELARMKTDGILSYDARTITIKDFEKIGIKQKDS